MVQSASSRLLCSHSGSVSVASQLQTPWRGMNQHAGLEQGGDDLVPERAMGRRRPPPDGMRLKYRYPGSAPACKTPKSAMAPNEPSSETSLRGGVRMALSNTALTDTRNPSTEKPILDYSNRTLACVAEPRQPHGTLDTPPALSVPVALAARPSRAGRRDAGRVRRSPRQYPNFRLENRTRRTTRGRSHSPRSARR